MFLVILNGYVAVVTAVHPVVPLVLMYMRVDELDPSLRRYSDPWAAESVGVPEPKYMPKLAVLDTEKPAPVVPPAGMAVSGKAVRPPDVTRARVANVPARQVANSKLADLFPATDQSAVELTRIRPATAPKTELAPKLKLTPIP